MHCFVRTAKLIGRAGGILFALIFWYFCIKTKVRKKKKEISINSFRNFWLQAFIKVGHCFLGNYFPQTAINGNISCLSTDYYTTTPLLKSFRYDKLNRIKQMQTAGVSAGEWGSPTDNFSTEYRYDYNGNILSLQRKDANAQIMHHINYAYNAKNNRLQAITSVGINSSTYGYDAIGNLTNDSGENINVTWNAMNKVKTVVTPNSTLHFAYSPTGQRQIKKTGDKTEYYLHDATGNIMCIYELSGKYLTVKERTIYGSKRIGVYRQRIRFGYSSIVGGVVIAPGSDLINILNPQPIISPDGRHYLEGSNRLQVIGVNRAIAQTSTISYTYKKGTAELKGLSPLMAVRPTFLDGTKTAGLRDYELTDHLSNVMAVISDRKLSVDANGDTITDYYEPQVVSFTDYYPFGFPMAERSGNLSGYRFGFNGQESDNEVYGTKQSYTAEFWQYDTRLGRRWNVDPVIKQYESPYACFENNPINVIDIEGEDGKPKPASQRKIDRVDKKFKEKILDPLITLEIQGASSAEIFVASASLAQKYQRKKWFRTFFSDNGIEEVVPYKWEQRYNSTNWKINSYVAINPYPSKSIISFSIENERPSNKEMVNSGSTDIVASPESTVSVQFSPFGVENSITVYSINSNGERVNLINKDMFANEMLQFDITLSESTAGEIYYEIKNTLENKEIDNWKLEINVTTPKFAPQREIRQSNIQESIIN